MKKELSTPSYIQGAELTAENLSLNLTKMPFCENRFHFEQFFLAIFLYVLDSLIKGSGKKHWKPLWDR